MPDLVHEFVALDLYRLEHSCRPYVEAQCFQATDVFLGWLGCLLISLCLCSGVDLTEDQLGKLASEGGLLQELQKLEL